jgi:photosystem II stability/assembly factor-like uncharacterized protein
VGFAVGQDATILRYSDSGWAGTESGLILPAVLYDVWGISSSDVFAVGWVEGGGSVGGTVIHYDGVGWNSMGVLAPLQSLQSVWGSSHSDVFVVGDGGTILHFDGDSWTPMQSGTAASLSSVWGSSGSDVFAIGASTILHYDGSSWIPMALAFDPPGNLRSVWGRTGKDVFVVGNLGTFLHYDGSSWSEIDGTTHGSFGDISGIPGGDLFTVGQEGRIQRHGN